MIQTSRKSTDLAVQSLISLAPPIKSRFGDIWNSVKSEILQVGHVAGGRWQLRGPRRMGTCVQGASFWPCHDLSSWDLAWILQSQEIQETSKVIQAPRSFVIVFDLMSFAVQSLPAQQSSWLSRQTPSIGDMIVWWSWFLNSWILQILETLETLEILEIVSRGWHAAMRT